MASGGVIGNAVIEVTVDQSKVAAGFAQAGNTATKESAKVAKQIDSQGGLLGAAGGIKQFSKPLREFREAIQGTASAVFGFTGTIGLVAAGIAGIVAGLREAWAASTRITTAFDRTGYSVGETANQAQRLLDRLNKITEKNKPGLLTQSADAKKLLDDAEFAKIYDTQKKNAEDAIRSKNEEADTLDERIRNARRFAENPLNPDKLRSAASAEANKLTERLSEVVRQRDQLQKQLDNPESTRRRQGIQAQIQEAENKDILDLARELDDKRTAMKRTATERLSKEEADAIEALNRKAVGVFGDRRAAYQELENSMRRFYQAERDEIARTEAAAIKAQVNAQKGATADAILGMNTSVSEISTKLDQVANLLRSMN